MHVLGCYIAPDYASTIEIIVEAGRHIPQWAMLLLADNFIAYLTDTKGDFGDKYIAMALAIAGL